MSSRHSLPLMLIRPFRIRLSILDLRTTQSSNTNETSTINSSSQRRLNINNPLTLKLNEFLIEQNKYSIEGFTEPIRCLAISPSGKFKKN